MRGLGRVYSLSEIGQLALPILQQHGIKHARPFGSYAKGNATPSSDVDLAIDTDKRGFDFTAILSDLFNVFGYGNVDLYANYELEEDPRLRDEILRTGVELF